MIRKRSTCWKKASLASTRRWSAAPRARDRSASPCAAASSMPPVSTVTVTTGRLYVSASHGIQNDVSSPPEKASTMGSDMDLPLLEENFQTLDEAPLIASRGRGHEDGVVAGHGSHQLRPAGPVDGEAHSLCRPGHGEDDGEIRPRGLDAAQEMGDLGHSGIALVVLRRPRIPATHPSDPEVPQVPADARLSDRDAPLAQQLHQLPLARHPVAVQDRQDLLLAAFAMFVVMGHGRLSKQIHAHDTA